MNSPIQNSTVRVARRFIEPAGAPRAEAPAGRLGGQEVRRAGFSWGTAGRIVAGIMTAGLSEMGYAVFKACTRPEPDVHRPLGRAGTLSRESQELVAQMSSSDAEPLPKAASNAVPVGSVGQLYEAEHRARMDMLMGPGADYDMDEINAVAPASAGTTNKAEKAKQELISNWHGLQNKSQITINNGLVELPAPFAKDCIQRGEVAIEDGKLMATLKKQDNSDEHMSNKIELVDRVVTMMLEDARKNPSALVTDAEKAAFKQNLFSFTYQDISVLYVNEINAQTQLVPMNPEGGKFNFSFSATDGKNVVIEHEYDVKSFPLMTNTNIEINGGSFISNIVFSVPIEQLKRTDFDPSCLTVVSADWQYGG
jgi:hypothetical protein